MKKILALLVMLSILATAVSAIKPESTPVKGGNTHLYLYEKDPLTWDIVEDPVWGLMNINHNGKFVFNGHGVEVTDYTLINYGGWPDVQCLGSATANEDGNVHIKGIMPEELLIEGENDGAKIWLVNSADVDCDTSKMVAWVPETMLFENNLI